MTIIGIVGYCTEMVILILVVNRSSPVCCTGWRRRKSRNAVPLPHDVTKRQLLSTKNEYVTKENLNEYIMKEFNRCVKKTKYQ
jgi:hypothetical protein